MVQRLSQKLNKIAIAIVKPKIARSYVRVLLKLCSSSFNIPSRYCSDLSESIAVVKLEINLLVKPYQRL